jgi:P-type Ca2+ transporter type 2C
MNEPPRNPKDNMFANGGLAFMVVFGAVIGAVTLTAFLYLPVLQLIDANMTVSLDNIISMLKNEEVLMHAQTYAFTTLAITQLFNAIGVRNLNRSIFRINHLNNKMMIVAFVVGFALQVAVTEIPFLTNMFGTVELSLNEWLILAGLSTVPLWVHEIIVLSKIVRKKIYNKDDN